MGNACEPHPSEAALKVVVAVPDLPVVALTDGPEQVVTAGAGPSRDVLPAASPPFGLRLQRTIVLRV